MKNWKEKYKEKFGLCVAEARTTQCHCADEIKFIENLLLAQKEQIFNAIREGAKNGTTLEKVAKANN